MNCAGTATSVPDGRRADRLAQSMLHARCRGSSKDCHQTATGAVDAGNRDRLVSAPSRPGRNILLAIRHIPLLRARRRAGTWLIGLAAAAALGAAPLHAAAHSADLKASDQSPLTSSPGSAHNAGSQPSDQSTHSTSPAAPLGSAAPSSSFPGYRIVSTAGVGAAPRAAGFCFLAAP